VTTSCCGGRPSRKTSHHLTSGSHARKRKCHCLSGGVERFPAPRGRDGAPSYPHELREATRLTKSGFA